MVLDAARAVLDERDLDIDVLPSTLTLDRPRNPDHGDYAANLALQVAKRVDLQSRELAAAIADKLGAREGIKSVEVAGPGFLNIRLDAAAAGQIAAVVVTQGSGYGRSAVLAGQRINLEFVSANPTGPIHIGGVRWAAVGDAIARLLRSVGAEVSTEYYFNDAGSQITRFARSLLASARGEEVPEDGYRGAYIDEIASRIDQLDQGASGRPDALERFHRLGVGLMFEEIKESLAAFGVHFDVYFNEKDLHEGGAIAHAIDELRTHGRVFEADGAVWLRTTDFGDDKDRVLIRSSGETTYFAADAAYYLNKRERGFDKCIILLGADHHGYIGRLRAIAACAGDDPDQTLEIPIGQLVNLVRDGEPVRMSKRAGTVVNIEDIVDALGVDAARYALARYSADSPIDLDLDLWTRRSNDNPVFYVQYAHARIASLLRNAADLGLKRSAELNSALLGHDRETDLLKALGAFPEVVATAASLREPHRVARYLEALAGSWHRFYDACRVLPQGDEPVTELSRARLWLVEATRIVLANGLDLLGVSAPERM